MSNNIESKLEKIHNELVDIKLNQVKHTISLEEHMRRSAAAEERLDIVEQNLVPIRNHVLILNTFFKIFVFLATMAISIKKLFL